MRLEEDMATKLAAADAEAAEVRRQREMVEAQLREAQATAGSQRLQLRDEVAEAQVRTFWLIKFEPRLKAECWEVLDSGGRRRSRRRVRRWSCGWRKPRRRSSARAKSCRRTSCGRRSDSIQF